MSKKPKLSIPLSPISDLQKLLSLYQCKGIIIGGIASSLLGKPRFTADIDVLVILDNENIPRFLTLAKKTGIISRINNPAEFAQKNRVFLMRHKTSGINIDISLGILPFEKEAIERSKPVKIKSVTFRIPTPEDLIIFKAVAHRDKDILDIKEIVNSHPQLDIKRIKKNINEFAKVLEMPEIWDNIKGFFKHKKPKQKKA